MRVAIDIGGTTTRIARAPADRPAIELIERMPTRSAFADEMVAIEGVLAGLPAGEISGIGVSVGARVARDGSRVAVAPNLRDYEGQPLAARLAERFQVPVRLAHDTICGLLAEATSGALRGVDRAAYLTVSTGTGAAVRLGRDGAHVHLSIEFGHQLLAGNTLPCLCGQIGCVETLTGGRQLAARYGREVEAIDDPRMWGEIVDALAIGIVNLGWLTRVERVALGGGIALGSRLLRERLPARMAALRVGESPLELVWSALGERAPLLGALALLDTAESGILH
ncbi:MAG TPA: ROK family protein [Ktedonobacterales bacterium]